MRVSRRLINQWAAALAWLTSLSAPALAPAAARPPLSLSDEGYFFVGGSYIQTPEGQVRVGQMYVDYRIPTRRTHALPIVMFSGGSQSGLNYSGTPDGREGWAEYFLRLGYAVYLLDQPARARSPWQPEMGPLTRPSTEQVQWRFTAPERYNAWPQAKLHTQWPGTGVAGDPIFDQYYDQMFPSLGSFAHQQELNRDAGAALLDKIGPAILLTHSQSGTFGWLVADARPKLVKAIVALEPSGPPAYDLDQIGPPNWFKDGALTKPYGLTAPPLAYAPAVSPEHPLSFVRNEPAGPDLAACVRPGETRSLRKLRRAPYS